MAYGHWHLHGHRVHNMGYARHSGWTRTAVFASVGWWRVALADWIFRLGAKIEEGFGLEFD
jgi:hypothetical protein